MTVTASNRCCNSAGDIVEFLRNQQTGPNAYPGSRPNISNWRDEQWAWQHSCVLYNQCYHMVDLAVEGPDAFAMLNHLGINSFKGFVPDKAKQFVPVTPKASSSATSSSSTSPRTSSTWSAARR